MEKINVAKLLKYCPKGMELDSPVWNNIVFEEIDGDSIVIFRTSVGAIVYLTQYGEINSIDGNCVIFPKGKTTWEGFVPPCKPCEFKDGDIVYVKSDKRNEYIIIFKEIRNDHIHKYVCFAYQHLSIDKCALCHLVDAEIMRLATEEEKQKLFDAIKDNGYKWNTETKTLEKLVPNKFDITTLIPFESKVLARDSELGKWCPAIWGFYNDTAINYPYDCIGGDFAQCIPYEGNEHLLGTTNDCDEYYKTWEK